MFKYLFTKTVFFGLDAEFIMYFFWSYYDSSIFSFNQLIYLFTLIFKLSNNAAFLKKKQFFRLAYPAPLFLYLGNLYIVSTFITLLKSWQKLYVCLPVCTFAHLEHSLNFRRQRSATVLQNWRHRQLVLSSFVGKSWEPNPGPLQEQQTLSHFSSSKLYIF